jgi:hypothetical protein
LLTQHAAFTLVLDNFCRLSVLFVEKTAKLLHLETGLKSPLFCTQYYREKYRACALLSMSSECMRKISALPCDSIYGYWLSTILRFRDSHMTARGNRLEGGGGGLNLCFFSRELRDHYSLIGIKKGGCVCMRGVGGGGRGGAD